MCVINGAISNVIQALPVKSTTRACVFSWTYRSCVQNGNFVDSMVSVMEESVMPDPVLGCPVSDTSHDDYNDDSDVSMIDSDSDSSMDVSAPDLSMLDHFLFLKFTTSRQC